MNYKEYWEKGMSYRDYRAMIDTLLLEDKTTGENHSEAMLDYTRMNVQRMKRIDKTYSPNMEMVDLLKDKDIKEYWLVITEGWCGDAAQILPALEKLSAHFAGIEMRMVLRDENLELMDAYLTNGVSRSIPILIRLSQNDYSVLGKWGPRPSSAQKILTDSKENGLSYEAIKEAVHLWYARNKSKEIEQEVLGFLSKG
jgi:hypothetical protein